MLSLILDGWILEAGILKAQIRSAWLLESGVLDV